jgi:putative ABC transport system permease protein
MTTPRQFWARIVALFRRDALDRDFDEELAAHVEMAAEEFVRQGVSPAEARRRALARLGGVESPKQMHRDARGLPWLEGLLFDLRQALRGLRRDWTFTLAITAMLALALGLNTTVFTVMDAMLFRGFPHVKRNDRLLYVQERSASGMRDMSYADFEDWRAEARSFEGLAFVGGQPIAFRDGDGRPADIRAITVSAHLFGLLGVPPMLGRDFVTADERHGAPRVAILTQRFWESRFASRDNIVGSTVHINSQPTTIIGVMPARFEFPMPASGDLWMPVVRSPAQLRRGPSPGAFTVVARLRDGVTRDEARAELEAINRQLEVTYPDTNRGLVPTAIDYSEFVSGGDAWLIWGSLWVGACFVLLIACANAANLTLVRTVGRWREFATRLALGAGQGRMIRTMLIETTTIGGVAATIAWWIAVWSTGQWEAATLSRYQVVDYTVNAGTAAYLAAISIVAALLLSVVPIARVVQLGASGGLKSDARGVTHGLRGRRLAAGLVAGQMALAIVLLSGAGVIMRSFVAIVSAESGVRSPQRVLVGVLRLPSDRYPTPGARLAYFDRFEARLKEITGIEAVSVASVKPVRGVNPRRFEIDGGSARLDNEPSVQFVTVAPDYLRVLGLTAISGREFTDDDRAASLQVALVNERFAATHWPGQQPLGQRLRARDADTGGPWRTVVGVVPNIMQGDSLRQEFRPLVYVPLHQEPPARAAYFLARTTGPAKHVAQAVHAGVQALDSDVSLEDLMTLEAGLAFERDFMDAAHSELGKYSTVAPVFAAIALLLAATGLVAVIAHSVGQRTKEIGVRMAIGARTRDIGRMILREGMRPVLAGLTLGLIAAFAVNRILQSQLVGVTPYDPLTMTAGPAVLIVVALIACRIPAHRAMRVDPVVALRHE